MPLMFMALIDDEDDKQTFRDIYEKYETTIFAYVMNILKNNALAEEAVSETFLLIAKNFKRVSRLRPDELVPYILIISRNVSINIIKSEERFLKMNKLSDLIISSSWEKKFDEEMEILITAEAVKALPEPLMETIMLKYYYGFTVKEIAQHMHLSVGGVKSRLAKARMILRKELSEDE